MRFKQLKVCLILLVVSFGCNENQSDIGTSGQGGSLSRFSIHGPYLYVASNSSIQVFDISSHEFKKLNTIEIGFGLETIFAKGDYLYLGAIDAMYIYSIANPQLPTFVFRYEHIVSCDPVVVQGTKAYVTLKSGNRCNLGSNALEIIDISNPYNPFLIANYPMTAPGGLAIDGDCLFICEGEFGLKMLDVANPLNIKVILEITDVNAYDVIAGNGVLKLTGHDGIFQYEYNCSAKTIRLMSKIPVERDKV